ncbi:MAG: hybrid sensor histidine kinase/response regulator [Candidatus Cloacimonadales bacterium]
MYKPKILIVDDNPANLVSLEVILEIFEAEIIRASSGREALEKLAKQDFALLLIDVQMPELSGFETVKLMRQVKRTRYVPVIFISGVYSDEYFQSFGLDTGAADFMIKPIVEKLLQNKVQVFLQLAEQKHQLQEKLQRNSQMTKIIKVQKEHLGFVNQILRHDLTNFLTAIQSALRLAKHKEDPAYYQQALSYVKRSVNLIEKMRQLEDFYEADHKLAEIDLRQLISKICSSYQKLQIRINGNAKIYGDGSISSMLDNIISNAERHAKADRLEISLIDSAEEVEIRIADNGVGIPDEIKSKIFERNYHFGESGNTGVGLYIAKKTIELYQGDIFVEDNNPKGAVFVVKLAK